jgi:hypothetical protein
MIRRLVLPLVILLAGCGDMPGAPPSLVEVIDRPAEKALLNGLRAYDDAAYAESEKLLGQALQLGLRSYKDRAAAHKVQAFIYCTSNRNAECEAAFRAARQADPAFALSKSESGHPQWGQIYKRTRL